MANMVLSEHLIRQLEENRKSLKLEKIKFRGKRLDNGEYVFGDLIQLPPVRIINESGEYPINPESVAQFVDYDIDGKELYEGDHVVEVEFRRGWEKYAPPLEVDIEFYSGCYPELETQMTGCCTWHGFRYVGEETFDRCIRNFHAREEYNKLSLQKQQESLKKAEEYFKKKYPNAKIVVSKHKITVIEETHSDLNH